jgi:uncharacterized protein YjbI with pentapeptide repeats
VAIEEQVEVLLSGVEAWNDWRAKQPDGTVIDLSGVDLRSEAIGGRPLAGPKGKADLRGAELEDATLRGARLAGANLSEAHLEGANLFAADLEGAILRYAHLEGTLLSEANLKGADLFGTHLEGANLFQARLEDAALPEARLEGAYLPEAHLERADLFGAHLENAIFDDAFLQEARLQGAHLEGADLRGAHLEGANLHQAHLKGADLREAHLEGAALRGAHLGGRRRRLATPVYWAAIAMLLLSLSLGGERVRDTVALCAPVLLTLVLLVFPRVLTKIQSSALTALFIITGLLVIASSGVQLVMMSRGEVSVWPWIGFSDAYRLGGLFSGLGQAALTSMTHLWLLFMPAHLFVANETGLGLFVLPPGRERGPAWRIYLINLVAGGLILLVLI